MHAKLSVGSRSRQGHGGKAPLFAAKKSLPRAAHRGIGAEPSLPKPLGQPPKSPVMPAAVLGNSAYIGHPLGCSLSLLRVAPDVADGAETRSVPSLRWSAASLNNPGWRY